MSGRLLLECGGFSPRGFDVGRSVVAPALTDNALPRLDVVINSHPDTDHLAGLLFLLATFRVGGYYGNGDAPAPELTDLERAALAAGGIRKRTLAAGDILALAPELRLEVFWPPEEKERKESVGQVHKGNNASLVLRLLWRDKPLALLCGDAGSTALRALTAERGASLAADVLLLPHHGSAGSLEPAFYSAVKPRLALVSCGFLNRFGFPAAAVRRELHRRGIPLYSTAGAGQIDVCWTDPGTPPTLEFARPEALPEQPPGGSVDTNLQSTGLQLGINATGGRAEMRSISAARRDHARAAAELSKQREAVLKATWYEIAFCPHGPVVAGISREMGLRPPRRRGTGRQGGRTISISPPG